LAVLRVLAAASHNIVVSVKSERPESHRVEIDRLIHETGIGSVLL